MKKLIIDACTKTTFCFKIRFISKSMEHLWISTSSCLNIYEIDLGSAIVKELFHQSLVEAYLRYGDDALLLVKEINIYLVQKPLYFFDKSIKLIVDTFKDGKVYCLDI